MDKTKHSFWQEYSGTLVLKNHGKEGDSKSIGSCYLPFTVYSGTLCEYECVHVCVKLKHIFFIFSFYSISHAFLSLARLILSAVKSY